MRAQEGPQQDQGCEGGRETRGGLSDLEQLARSDGESRDLELPARSPVRRSEVEPTREERHSLCQVENDPTCKYCLFIFTGPLCPGAVCPALYFCCEHGPSASPFLYVEAIVPWAVMPLRFFLHCSP